MKRLLVSISILFTVACLSCTDRDDDVASVNLRIKNNTSFAFNKVLVLEKDTMYINIGTGEYSQYYEFEQASAEMSLAIETDSVTFNYQAQETILDSLPIGFYTYELSLDEEKQVTLNFRIDN
ncbi:hypothetical protein ACOCEA_10900 [Maribacter sp. CXY002]|uniref:hypothetical protein n=1 Tax=Maribacter luteocoastalis TaxID=3407671 RepID=UPI003B6711DE